MNNWEVSVEEAERMEEEAKENDEFMKMMGDTMGFEQPDGTVKFFKIDWIG